MSAAARADAFSEADRTASKGSDRKVVLMALRSAAFSACMILTVNPRPRFLCFISERIHRTVNVYGGHALRHRYGREAAACGVTFISLIIRYVALPCLLALLCFACVLARTLAWLEEILIFSFWFL